MTFWLLSLETVTISSRERIDVKISAAATGVVDKHSVLLGPFIQKNPLSANPYSSLVSSEILSPLWFRNVDQPVDHTEQPGAFFLIHLIHLIPPSWPVLFPWGILRQLLKISSWEILIAGSSISRVSRVSWRGLRLSMHWEPSGARS